MRSKNRRTPRNGGLLFIATHLMTEEEEIKFLNFIYAIIKRYCLDETLFPELGGRNGDYMIMHKEAAKSITQDIVARINQEANERGLTDCSH